MLRELLPGFEEGALKPFPVTKDAQYGLNRIADAYAAVMTSSRQRVFIVPEAEL